MKCCSALSIAVVLLLFGEQNNFANARGPGNSILKACRVGDLFPEGGRCLAYVPSYYYDGSNGTCKSFVYGGCGGNKNRFATLQKCQQIQRLCQKSYQKRRNI